jgi:hypothetical protein
MVDFLFWHRIILLKLFIIDVVPLNKKYQLADLRTKLKFNTAISIKSLGLRLFSFAFILLCVYSPLPFFVDAVGLGFGSGFFSVFSSSASSCC